MANDLLKKIELQIADMTTAQRKVADHILSDPFEASFSTIDKLAHASGVSTASVIRLANAIGYDTFSEFQEGLKDCMRSAAAPVHRLSINLQSVDEEEDSLVNEVFKQGIENLNATVGSLDEGTLLQIADRLDKAQAIYVTGARTSESTARYLTFNLNRMFQNALYVGEALTDQYDLIKKADSSDAVIVISNSRYNKVLCETAGRCKEKGSYVIGITDSFDSPVTMNSSVQLVGKCWSADYHNSILAQIFIADALIKACSDVNTARVQRSLEYDEQFFHRGNYYIN